MVDGSLSDKTDGGIRDPFPENNVLAVHVRLEPCVSVNVEYLQLPLGYGDVNTSPNRATGFNYL